jgi:hypothetical protein
LTEKAGAFVKGPVTLEAKVAGLEAGKKAKAEKLLAELKKLTGE